MYKVAVAAGGLRGVSVKVASFATKKEAIEFVTVQLNHLSNNPAVKKWDISMREVSVVSIHQSKHCYAIGNMGNKKLKGAK